MATAAAAAEYPVQFDVRYPEKLSRWLLFFRLPLLVLLLSAAFIPLILVALTIAAFQAIAFVTILNDGRYPLMLVKPMSWYLRLSARLSAYESLLTDRFPLDEDSAVELDITVPDRCSRLTAFFRFLMLIPHLIVLEFLAIAVYLTTFISWWAILFTGRYPRGLFDFAVGFFRWSTRVSVYSFFLTDKYPPFSMSA